MQTVSLHARDNLHEVSYPIFKKNKTNIISLSSAEFAHSMVSVKKSVYILLLNVWCKLNKSKHTVYVFSFV